MANETTLPGTLGRRRWDPIVKLTHWTIALAVLVNAIVTEEGSQAHVWVGYALAAMLALRLVWGLIGLREARFSSFPPSPARALSHVRDIVAGRHAEHRSHNPLGALMVYSIWACLIVIIGTGVAMAAPPDTIFTPSRVATVSGESAAMVRSEGHDEEEDEQESGSRYGEGESEEGPIGEVHEVAANLLYVLILLHLAGVMFESRRSGGRVVAAMLPGQRRPET